MKLHGVIALHVSGEEVLRRPGVLDKVKRWFGGEPDLRTGRLRASLEATAVVDAARDALRKVGATNALSLVVDKLVVFQDREGRPDDLGDLFLAFHEHSAAIGGGFELLRLAVEHKEAGLHLIVELQARTEHPVEEPALRVVVSGRIAALEPRPGEDADAYRARVEPLTRDAALIEVSRAQFESFVARVREAFQLAMPEARVEVLEAQAQVQRPPRRRERAAAPPEPTSRGYDPHAAYYPSPLHGMLSLMMWSSIFSMAMRPDVVVVNQAGDALGHAGDQEMAAEAEAGFDGDGDPGDGGDGGDFGDGGGDFGDGGDFGGDFGDFGFD